MDTRNHDTTTRRSFQFPWAWAVCLSVAIAVVLLWDEHRAHMLGALPYLLVLACPIIHLFMHGNHRRHARHRSGGRP